MSGIVLPEQFLPCIDDHSKLRIMADYLEERGEVRLARHLRWTANEWEWGRGMRRADIRVGQHVWARFWTQGWSRAVVQAVDDRKIVVAFPHRRRRSRINREIERLQPPVERDGSLDFEGEGFRVGRYDFLELSAVTMPSNPDAVPDAVPRRVVPQTWQLGERAWWDLALRGRWGDERGEFGFPINSTKPKPRKGYGATTNARLAKALTKGLKESLLHDAEQTLQGIVKQVAAGVIDAWRRSLPLARS